MSQNLLQSAIMHAAMRGLSLDDARRQAEEEIEARRSRDDDEQGLLQGDSDDDAMTDVHSITSTRPSSPFSSRPGSPAPGLNRKLNRPSRLRNASASAKLDPLKRFPTNVNLKIFSQLSVQDLKKCSQLCRRWKSSQTLNHVWYLFCQDSTWNADAIIVRKQQWTRRESKTDWRGVYRRIHRRDDTSAPVGLEGYKYDPTTGEWFDPSTVGQLTGKAAIWAQENKREETKEEARDRYKSMGSRSKPKGKREKWTGAKDITGYEEPVEYDD